MSDKKSKKVKPNYCAWCGIDRNVKDGTAPVGQTTTDVCSCPHDSGIFVFGSNLAGIHGAGAARYALEEYAAEMGVGFGPTGLSYAIPTKDELIQTLPLEEIRPFVEEFLVFAREQHDTVFLVTAIGTGLAGFTHEEIAPMFEGYPSNCMMPLDWRGLVKGA